MARPFIFDADNKIAIEICNELYLQLKQSEKDRIETARQQAYQHASLNHQNAVQLHSNAATAATHQEQNELISVP